MAEFYPGSEKTYERSHARSAVSFLCLDTGLAGCGLNTIPSGNQARSSHSCFQHPASYIRANQFLSGWCSMPASGYLANQYPFTIHFFKRLTFQILLLLISIPAHAAQYRVVAVSDGDTLTIEPVQGGDRAKVRLHGIDAPELRQPYGQAVKALVVNTALFKEVDVRPSQQGKDRYGRIVAVVDVPGAGILQELLLEAGLAWVWPRYCRDCGAWEAIQAKARDERRGLWADENPVAPWEWRKIEHRGRRAGGC
jgi:endonuclease YncB( thermonuclease family)